uniref:Uncharacterized protein n=1 Tax=Setaria viridis TaxID=4556 RepID=A0A4U6TUA4_SETVI|nr:hypothetical protein SEVIR_7G126600v2 [Setaria viridis]
MGDGPQDGWTIYLVVAAVWIVDDDWARGWLVAGQLGSERDGTGATGAQDSLGDLPRTEKIHQCEDGKEAGSKTTARGRSIKKHIRRGVSGPLGHLEGVDGRGDGDGGEGEGGAEAGGAVGGGGRRGLGGGAGGRRVGGGRGRGGHRGLGRRRGRGRRGRGRRGRGRRCDRRRGRWRHRGRRGGRGRRGRLGRRGRGAAGRLRRGGDGEEGEHGEHGEVRSGHRWWRLEEFGSPGSLLGLPWLCSGEIELVGGNASGGVWGEEDVRRRGAYKVAAFAARPPPRSCAAAVPLCSAGQRRCSCPCLPA